MEENNYQTDNNTNPQDGTQSDALGMGIQTEAVKESVQQNDATQQGSTTGQSNTAQQNNGEYEQRPSQLYGRTAYQQQNAQNQANGQNANPYGNQNGYQNNYNNQYGNQNGYQNNYNNQYGNQNSYQNNYNNQYGNQNGYQNNYSNQNGYQNNYSNQNGYQNNYNNQYGNQNGYQNNYNNQYGNQNGYQNNYNNQYGNQNGYQNNYNNQYGYQYNNQNKPVHGKVSDIFCYFLLVIMPLANVITIALYSMAFKLMEGLSYEEFESVYYEKVMELSTQPAYLALSMLTYAVAIGYIVFIILDIVKIHKQNYKITGLILFAIFLKPGYFLWRAHVLGRKKTVPVLYTIGYCALILGQWIYFIVKIMSISMAMVEGMY